MVLARASCACFVAVLSLAGLVMQGSETAQAAAADEARQILEATGVTGGLIIHVGCGDGRLTAALHAGDRYLVHGLDTDAANVRAARKHIRSMGLYGSVSVDRFDGVRLPYAENLANLIVAEDLGDVSMAEVMRVLCPRGVAYLKSDGRPGRRSLGEGGWTKTVKPWPDDIDEWTHYLHGPDGNPVAQDRVVAPPRHYQWICGPLWMRSHESDASVKTLVTARGRLFYIADEAPISLVGDHSLPDKWFLTAGDEDWPAFRHDAMRSGSAKTAVPAAPKLLWREDVGKKLAPPIIVGGRLFAALVDQHRLVALNTADGKQQWEFTAGARIDSPPTYYRSALLFGSADGWVYCVRAADGTLVWRFRAAPEDRRIGAFGQLESAWPVHGSVLVRDGTAYFAAGRSSHVDGGIYLFGVDAVSGKVRCRTRLEGPAYNVDNISQNYRLPMGALPDILQGEDDRIYMRHLVFDTNLQPQKPPPKPASSRVRSKAGLLDNAFFKRSPWTFGPQSSYGRLIVHDARAAYVIRMFDTLRGLDPKVYFTPAKQGYLLFALDSRTGKQTWQRRIPVRVNAMVATGGLLFVAGLPDVVDPKDPLGAFEGRKGGVLSACNKADGKALWKCPLPAPPVFNGLAAASGRLYVAMQDGSIACFGR